MQCESLRHFKGNIAFASVNAMNCFTTSRKDDLISLIYLIVYMIDGNLPFLPNSPSRDDLPFSNILRKKQKLTTNDICYNNKLKGLESFIT